MGDDEEKLSGVMEGVRLAFEREEKRKERAGDIG
jgi:hypothetical protein